jgi:hypothetical protein
MEYRTRRRSNRSTSDWSNVDFAGSGAEAVEHVADSESELTDAIRELERLRDQRIEDAVGIEAFA